MPTITLESSDHGTYLLRSSIIGKTRLIQTDWDYPGIASAFGWSPRRVQLCTHCRLPFDCADRECSESGGFCYATACPHPNTDGTVDCKCGVTSSAFISSAHHHLDGTVDGGAPAEDPGYFTEF